MRVGGQYAQGEDEYLPLVMVPIRYGIWRDISRSIHC